MSLDQNAWISQDIIPIEFDFDRWLVENAGETQDVAPNETHGLSSNTMPTNNTMPSFEASSLNFDTNIEDAADASWLDDQYSRIVRENPFQTGFQHSHNIPAPTGLPYNSSPLPSEYGSTALSTPGVAGYSAISKPGKHQTQDSKPGLSCLVSKADKAKAVQKPPRKTRSDKGMKREPRRTGKIPTVTVTITVTDINTSLTGNREGSESTVQGDKIPNNMDIKRKRSREDGEDSHTDCGPHERNNSRKRRLVEKPTKYEDRIYEWDDSNRPKSSRIGENGMLNAGLAPRPPGVYRLFGRVSNEVMSKKEYYYRRKGQPETNAVIVESSPAPSTGKKSRHLNRREHVPVGLVRESAPGDYDPFHNEYYSGDDNVSDGEAEVEGKATDYKPPRMACRTCNKLKQPCDHKYPSCSLCQKQGKRCRYRDPLTGRQIKPGQLEEVEAGYVAAKKMVRQLQEEVQTLKRELHASRKLGDAEKQEHASSG
ncbi:hypothetical protein TSTA_057080 [Talaromyces stipitatus ATCC 10500]|uniref:Zn(2)-C6 fungal-type domain-containing protein n=1 Tax=Talaromyces stipitatus (strain ATCC 10500 / CBS 375.48 / QM 6759 / NRRL 1006) TaxID=441959 RepID=B8MRQ5_TALSN|nr:uncharacterized protein TSTA_057080 [Talaromyces stipitatus ATCC 10500]EED13212.1 hypothetical protein TSTA_057080 [Talaromyces stipitatus ATCC 10500]